MAGTEAIVDHRHPRQQPCRGGGGGGGTTSGRLEPLSVLPFRAISDHRRPPIHNGRFQLLSVLLCGAVHAEEGLLSNQSKLCGILICGVLSVLLCGAIHGASKGRTAVDLFKMMCHILTRRVASDYISHKDIDLNKPATHLLTDLPEGVLCTILSKLSLDEVVRTSAVSRKWRHMWTVCPKLSFDGDTMCGRNNYPERLHVHMFIRNVNKVLAQCRGRLVEELAVKIDWNWMLVKHLDDCVSFAASSRTKALVFDLSPGDDDRKPTHRDGRYKFPFELLDEDSLRRLQKIHLAYVDFQPPMQFNGFPNLRKRLT